MKCTAKSARTGEPCKLNAITGGNVCQVHGGRAPQVKEAARRRHLERILALCDPALDTLARGVNAFGKKRQGVPDHAEIRAAIDVLDRAGYKPKDEVIIEGELTLSDLKSRVERGKKRAKGEPLNETNNEG